MASSSSNSRMSFKVFVSFREENVRNFVTHLYAALVHAGIYYFDVQQRDRDEGNLMITVPKMIEESDLAIIIFSEDNAYSRLCLEEVVKIMECKKQRDLKVFPVFYRVELGRVSGLKGSYRSGIEYFQKKLDKDARKLMRWKDALQEAGSLSGWYLDNETSEAKIIEDIVKKIFELKMYDVFLSFRGKDVREYFVNSLNEALVQKGIKTFMDSKNLETGQDFPSKLKEAIEQSRMYIVVFSENYAESWWCLKELVQIQGEKNRTKQLLPIFYKVAPREVRGQNPQEVSGKKQSYEKALTDHESEFGKRKVKKWKEALSKAANVNGIHLHDGNMSGCIARIVKEMEKMMQRIE